MAKTGKKTKVDETESELKSVLKLNKNNKKVEEEEKPKYPKVTIF